MNVKDIGVSIATHYGLDSPEIESQWGEIYRTSPDRPWGPFNLWYNWYWSSFPRVKLLGCSIDHPPRLTPNLKKQ
jgi:hypothetical protein